MFLISIHLKIISHFPLLLFYLKSSKFSATDTNVPLVKAFRTLVSGKDEDLIEAYTHFNKMIEEERRVVEYLTLAAVEQQEKETSAMHAGVRIILATTKRTDGNTETLMTGTGRMHECLESKNVSGPILFCGF